MQDMNPDWKKGVYGGKIKQTDVDTWQPEVSLCLEKAEQNEMNLARRSHLTVYSCAWTPEKVNYGEECREIWRAPSNVKVTRHPAG